MCEHDWQPISNWFARYRCTLCDAVGAKFGVVQGQYCKRSNEIQPYRCGARSGGVKCEHPAVYSGYGKKFRCAEHRHPARAVRARKGVTAANAAQAEATPRDEGRENEVPTAPKGS